MYVNKFTLYKEKREREREREKKQITYTKEFNKRVL